MSNAYFSCAQLFFLTILFNSVLTFETGTDFVFSSNATERRKRFQVSLLHWHRPLLIMIIFLVGGNIGVLACLVGVGLQFSMMALGFILKQKKILERCNCYGELSRGGRISETILSISLTAVCILIACICVSRMRTSNFFEASDSIALPLSLLLSALLNLIIFSKKIHGDDQSTSVASSASSLLLENGVTPSRDTIIGNTVDTQGFKLGGISAGNKPILIIGLAPSCEACTLLKANIIDLSTAFKGKIMTVIAFSGGENLTAFGATDSTILVHRADHFSNEFAEQGYPYALLLNPGSLRPLAPVVYGSKKIWMLYYLALGLTSQNA